MKQHLLIEKAFFYPIKEIIPQKELLNCTFDIKKGYWIILNELKAPLIFDPAKPRQASKKNDRETGEDQKRE